MKITQGVLKYCNIYNVKFEDKYSNIKTIKSTENYDSKFASNSGTSQTSTVLTDNNTYYNIVEHSNILSGKTLYNCDVETGRFLNSTFLTSNNNYIKDGYFSGCTISSGYTIYGGQFFDCVIDSGCTWKEGQWNSGTFNGDWYGGVWNSGVFPYPVWSGGTFNGGTFTNKSIWITGVANGGLFSGCTWNHGLVRNANFIGCIFKSGTFNNGLFSGGTFNGGTFNNGVMSNSFISGGTFNGGLVFNCSISGNTENQSIPKIDGGNFSNDKIYDGQIYNMNGSDLTVYYGKFYNGKYENSTFITGDIYNGLYLNLSGTTSGLTIHNGTFQKSNFIQTNVHNGSFTNCYSENIRWNYGVYTEGSMLFNLTGSYWRDGYWNDGTFTAKFPQTGFTSNIITIGDPVTTTTTLPLTTTTTTPMLLANVFINNASCDITITDIQINGNSINGVQFPLYGGDSSVQGTTNQFGLVPITIVYYYNNGNQCINIYNYYGYLNANQNAFVGSPFTSTIDIVQGETISILTDCGMCT